MLDLCALVVEGPPMRATAIHCFTVVALPANLDGFLLAEALVKTTALVALEVAAPVSLANSPELHACGADVAIELIPALHTHLRTLLGNPLTERHEDQGPLLAAHADVGHAFWIRGATIHRPALIVAAAIALCAALVEARTAIVRLVAGDAELARRGGLDEGSLWTSLHLRIEADGNNGG